MGIKISSISFYFFPFILFLHPTPKHDVQQIAGRGSARSGSGSGPADCQSRSNTDAETSTPLSGETLGFAATGKPEAVPTIQALLTD